MSIELTDKKRYELELENLTAVILSAARAGENLEPEELAKSLNIDLPTTEKLIAKLKLDQIIK